MIDYRYFKDRYPNAWIDETDFCELAEQAEAQISVAILHRTPNAEQLPAYKRAVAAQINHMAESDSVIGPVSIGKFSYGGSTDKGNISSAARNYLLPTGLLYRGLC